jgi:hypothetical protein
MADHDTCDKSTGVLSNQQCGMILPPGKGDVRERVVPRPDQVASLPTGDDIRDI